MLAVEDVVGADVQQLAAESLGVLGEVAGAERVDAVGVLGLGLSAVHVGVGGGVNDEVGLVALQSFGDGPGVGDVKLGARKSHGVVAAFGQQPGQLQTELSPGAGYEYLHRFSILDSSMTEA